jgi:hypothetical protein
MGSLVLLARQWCDGNLVRLPAFALPRFGLSLAR